MRTQSQRRMRTIGLLGLALVVALVGTIFFALRAFEQGSRLRRSADEPIRPWMSLPYIAHSYHVPPYVLYQALGLPSTPQPGSRPDRRPIDRIAREQGRSVDEIAALLMQAIAHARPPYPPPPPRPPGGVR